MAVSVIQKTKCIGCGVCVESCPMDVFRLDTIAKEKDLYSACRLACPLRVTQREYHNYIKLGMLDEAAQSMRLCHPMPAITGRLCAHPCETDCVRTKIDQAVNINGLEQYLGDLILAAAPSAPAHHRREKVAIFGSGPAGLSAAYFLALDGYAVTVFEKDGKAGGLLRSAIPAFRLPEDVLDRQLAFYQRMGITIKTGVQVGRDILVDDLRQQGFCAFLAATGAAKPVGLSVPGSDARGVTTAMGFLRQVKAGRVMSLPGKAAVIGGGSVALDAARTALRLGASRVTVISLECKEPGTKDSMLAQPDEIADAVAEGVVLHPRASVSAFEVQDGKVVALKCVECLSVRESDGRFNPVCGAALPEHIAADTVIIATGQAAEPDLVPAGFPLNKRGYIVADGATKWAAPGFFAAGDAVSGPATVVQALAAGQRAALTIARFLKGEDLAAGLDRRPQKADDPPKEKMEAFERVERRSVPADERKRTFQATVLQLSEGEAHMESERCLTCGSRAVIKYVDDCQVCRLCQHYCPTSAIDVTEGILQGALHSWDVVTLGQA